MALSGTFLQPQVRIYEPGLEEEWRRGGGVVHWAMLCMQFFEQPQEAEVAGDRLTGFFGNTHSFSTRLYHMSPSPPQHPMTALQNHCTPVSPCNYALGTAPPLPCHHSHLWPSAAPQASLSSHQGWDPGGNGALELLAESPREWVCTFWHAWRSLITHFDSVEKFFNTPDISVTKPAPHPSPTHYTFGIVSHTGANHTEDVEDLDSCECLHNA